MQNATVQPSATRAMSKISHNKACILTSTFNILRSKNSRCPTAAVITFGRADVSHQLKQILEEAGTDFLTENHYDENVIRDIVDGKFHRNLIASLRTSSEALWITLTMNTDGVTLYKKPPSSFWPVYLYINQLKPSRR